MKEIIARGLCYWLRAPRWYADVRNDEHTLVIARLLLSTCCLGAIIFRGGYVPAVLNTRSLFAFLLYSLAIFALYRLHANWHPLLYMAVHCADILWAGYLIVQLGQTGIFFAMALFVMACAAVRWGFCESAATAFLLVLFINLAYLFKGLPLPHRQIVAFEIFPITLLGAAIVGTVGMLAEAKASRGEAYSISRITREIRFEAGFEAGIRFINSSSVQLFGADRVLAALHNGRSGQSWLLFSGDPKNPPESGEIRNLPYAQYFFPEPADRWRAEFTEKGGRPYFRCDVLRDGKVYRDVSEFRIPDRFLSDHPCRILLGASVNLGSEHMLRIYVVNPARYFGGVAGLRFLDKGVQLVAPTISDLVLASRLKTDAEAAAVSRIARSLHDGVIQSLAGINLQLEELRIQAASEYPQNQEPLTGIQQSVQKAMVDLRELTQQLRSYEIDSSNFLGFLSNLAAKFQYEHGISAHFLPEVESVTLRPDVCGELARMVLEALVNVRKHSQANEVIVRLGHRNGDMVISILDNGCGFGFTGHRTHDELMTSGTGPSIIMERARSIRAKVSIESVEGSGTCLEISLPRG